MTSHVGAVSAPSAAEPRAGLLTLSLAVAAVAVMASSVGGPFLFDDVPLIYGNDRVHGFSDWPEWFLSTLWDTNYDPAKLRYTQRFWRPVVLLSYALDWRVGGGSPFPFHVTNLVLHALNASLLFRVLAGWLGARVPAALGALLFAVHPVQTESVAWIAGRTDSLCVLGLLVAVLGLRCWARQRALGAAALGAGLFVAFGSKEAAVVFPVLASIEVWSERRLPPSWASLRPLLVRVLPFAALSVAFFIFHRLFIATSPESNQLTLGARLALPLEGLGRYTALLAWPDELAIGRATIPARAGRPVPHVGYVVLGGLTAVALLGAAWRARRRQPAVALGLLAYGAMVLPVMSIVWLGYDVSASPRFLYVPMLGLTLAVGGLLERPLGERALLRGGYVALMAALGMRSFARASDYGDADVFWAREIAANERYMSAQQYVITQELKAHRPESALRLAHRWFSDPLVSDLAKAGLVRNVVGAALALTPDLDVASLRQLGAFADRLAAEQPGQLSLPRLGLSLRLHGGTLLLHLIGKDRWQYLLYSAEAASRAGDDEAAVRSADLAVRNCADCWTILPTGALILARAGQLERARALIEHARRVGPPDSNADSALETLVHAARWRDDGPPDALVREVGFYSALGAFGRAYRVAQPVLTHPPADPSSVAQLAELAALAGDLETARRLLARVLPEPALSAEVARLLQRVPWRDRPTSEGGG